MGSWSLGLVLTRSCALTAVRFFWATALASQPNSVRQRLREFCSAADDKSGAQRGGKRREVPVAACFVPLLSWVLSWWEGSQLALALDASSLGERFVVLAASVVYRGCAIPVAWVVLPAATKHAWKHEWLRLLRRLRPAIPLTMTGCPLGDRPGRPRGVRALAVRADGAGSPSSEWLPLLPPVPQLPRSCGWCGSPSSEWAAGWHPFLRVNAAE